MKFRSLLFVLFAVGSVALGEINLKAGDPESQVVAALGEPQGKAEMGATTLYMYDGGNVIVKDGKVASIPKDFENAAQQKQAKKIQQEQFEAEQKAKGLVLYKGCWVTSALKSELEANALKAELEAHALAAKKKSEQRVLATEKDDEKPSLTTEDEARLQEFIRGGMLWSDIIRSPEKYLEKFGGEQEVVTLRGKSRLKNAALKADDGTTVQLERRSGFSIEQNDRIIPVDTFDLTMEQRARIYDDVEVSGRLVEVTGTLQGTPPPRNPDIAQQKEMKLHPAKYGNYWIQATSVTFR